MTEGYVPDDWRTANITPIFKKGSKSYVGNYRPVSLTSVICKQHGFLARRSCLTNLLEYIDILTKLVQNWS